MTLRTILAPACLTVLSAFALDAHAAGTGVTYESIDSYQLHNNRLLVTGVVQGGSASAESSYAIESNPQTDRVTDNCLQMLLTSINRPGRFYFVLDQVTPQPSYACRLTRRP